MNILKSKKTLIIIFLAVAALFFVVNNACFAKKSSGSAEVKVITNDGFNLVGYISIPKKKSLENKAPLVILLHSLGLNSVDWRDFPNKIKDLDVAVLSMDLRGHGKSILNKKGKKRYWQNFNDAEFQKLPLDIISAIDTVRQQYPEVDVKNIAIVGSNLSANAAVIAARKKNKDVKALVLLSPTIDFKGLETRIPMAEYGNHPVLIMVSKLDSFSYRGSSELIKYAQGIKEFKVYQNSGNGMNMLKLEPDTQQIIIDWLKTNFVGAKASEKKH